MSYNFIIGKAPIRGTVRSRYKMTLVFSCQ